MQTKTDAQDAPANEAYDPPNPTVYDAVILGGGPAGAVAAIVLARAGRSVIVLEKSGFPRFHVGESLIPQDMDLFADLGLLDELARLPQSKKTGVEFALGDHSIGNRIKFDQSLVPGVRDTFNIERSTLDDALLAAAKRAGAAVHHDAKVEKILQLADGDVRVQVASPNNKQNTKALQDSSENFRGGEVRGRYLIDATGQSTVVARHLKTRRSFDDPVFQKIAYFGHYENVCRDNALGEDEITMVLCDEGWFWMIPIDKTRTSIGMVLDASVAKQVKRPANQMLAWGIERCPLIRERVSNAVHPEKNHSISDYSYSCAPYAGPGYFLVGDAATFLDPVFSTGIFLGMEGARQAAQQIDAVLTGQATPGQSRDRYAQFLRHGIRPFFRLIRAFYQPSFRDLFLNGKGPMQMHRAVISILAGQVFPKPARAVRWRMRLFYACVAAQRFLPLTPRRKGFSLLAEPAMPAASPSSHATKTADTSADAGRAVANV